MPSRMEIGLLSDGEPIISPKTYHKDNKGHTGIRLAAQSDSSNCVSSLLRYSTNLDVNIQDKNGRAPFQAVKFSYSNHLALTLLKHGVDPSIVKSWWNSEHDSSTEQDLSTEKKVSRYLKLWENAANGFDFGNVNALVPDIRLAEQHGISGSIMLEWEVPAVVNMSDSARVAEGEAQWLDPTQQVVLVSNGRSSDYMEKSTRCVQATTIAKYLAQRWETEWCSFVLGLLDLVQLADLSSENSGTLFDMSGYPLPL